MCGALIIDHVLCCVSPSAPYPNPGGAIPLYLGFVGGKPRQPGLEAWPTYSTAPTRPLHRARDGAEKRVHSAVFTAISPGWGPGGRPTMLPLVSFSWFKEHQSARNYAFFVFSVSPPARFEVFFSSASGLSSPFFCFPGNDCFSRTYPLPLVRVSKSKGENLIQAGPGGGRS